MNQFDGTAARRRLMRRPAEGKLGGVCVGMAEYFDSDVALIRAAWIILSIWPGAIVLGIVAYLAAWVLIPRADSPMPAAPRTRLVRSRSDRRIAGVCGGLAAYFDVDATIVRVTWVIASILIGAVIFGVVAYLLAWFILPPAPTATLDPSPSMP